MTIKELHKKATREKVNTLNNTSSSWQRRQKGVYEGPSTSPSSVVRKAAVIGGSIFKTKTKVRVSMKIKKTFLFLAPTQLLIHGQWWSKPSTHLSQMRQCTERGVVRISQRGQISSGWKRFNKFSIYSSYSSCFKMKPGSLQEVRQKEIHTDIQRIVWVVDIT